jgi:hypothetical protein
MVVTPFGLGFESTLGSQVLHHLVAFRIGLAFPFQIPLAV